MRNGFFKTNFLKTDKQMERRQAKLIDLNEWERSGGGGTGWSYINRKDSSIMLKLNKEEIPEEMSYHEYLISTTLYEMGISCPRVFDFVTDGTRFGMTVERMQGKKSYVRMIADNPELLEPLAKDFAVRSREFHSIRCDTAKFESKKDKCRRLFASCPEFPDDVKGMLYDCLDSLEDVQYPVHGDFTPGNIIRADGKDYWIDLGDFTYGDPDMDFACLAFLARYTPAKVVEYLFHLTKRQIGQFMEIYGREYYGDRWGSRELKQKLDTALTIKVALAIIDRHRAALLYLPLLRGQKIKFAIIMRIADILVRKFN